MILSCVVLTIQQCDGRTDRRKDASAVAKTRLALHAVARRNEQKNSSLKVITRRTRFTMTRFIPRTGYTRPHSGRLVKFSAEVRGIFEFLVRSKLRFRQRTCGIATSAAVHKERSVVNVITHETPYLSLPACYNK